MRRNDERGTMNDERTGERTLLRQCNLMTQKLLGDLDEFFRSIEVDCNIGSSGIVINEIITDMSCVFGAGQVFVQFLRQDSCGRELFAERRDERRMPLKREAARIEQSGGGIKHGVIRARGGNVTVPFIKETTRCGEASPGLIQPLGLPLGQNAIPSRRTLANNDSSSRR